jgi:hypothetical protein
VHTRTAEWFWDQEIFDFLAERLHLLLEPSMRHYVARMVQKFKTNARCIQSCFPSVIMRLKQTKLAMKERIRPPERHAASNR